MLGNSEESIKVIVVGDGNVGKTCMLRRFIKGDFIAHYRKTIGAEFMEKDVFLRSSDTTVKLMLWDTAGQEVFNALTQAYYRGAGAAVLAFSTVDRDSFMNIAGWKQRVESVCGPITMVLCQTKFDLSHEAVITNEEAEQLAGQLEVPLFRVSTKDDFNVTQLFEFTTQQCIEGAADAAAAAEANEDRATRESSSDAEGGSAPTAKEAAGEPTAGASRDALISSPSPAEPSAVTTTTATAPHNGAPSASPVTDPYIPATAGKSGKDAAAAVAGSVGKSKASGGKDKAGSPAKNKVSLNESDAHQQHHRKKKFKCSLY